MIHSSIIISDALWIGREGSRKKDTSGFHRTMDTILLNVFCDTSELSKALEGQMQLAARKLAKIHGASLKP